VKAGASGSCSGKLNEAAAASVVSAADAVANISTAGVKAGLQAAAAALANPPATSSSSSSSAGTTSDDTRTACECSHAVKFAGASGSSSAGIIPSSSSCQQPPLQQQQHGASATNSSRGSHFAERTAAVRPDRLQLLQDEACEGSGNSSSYVRGTTVCLAALGKSKTTSNDNDEVREHGIICGCRWGVCLTPIAFTHTAVRHPGAAKKQLCGHAWLLHIMLRCAWLHVLTRATEDSSLQDQRLQHLLAMVVLLAGL
jgi:hypothetical protein